MNTPNILFFLMGKNNHIQTLHLTILSEQFLTFPVCISCIFTKVLHKFIFTQGLAGNLFASFTDICF